ncbi:MAG: hypothetical protein KKG01_05565 [Candidatus Omnitrophica bacterium]|nr:hypothetical protein [Candidatus Omnitrophota bacterium]MBU4590372.1 hypothetical protein [Candidatus Omnitrophota bacterium]
MKLDLKLAGVVVLLALVFNVWTSEAYASCGGCGAGGESVDAVTEALPVSFKAEVICLGCALKKGQGAKTQCSLYGHVNALKSEDGRIWTILENDASTGLINSHEYAGKQVEITGKKFGGTQIIEIENFKLVE